MVNRCCNFNGITKSIILLFSNPKFMKIVTEPYLASLENIPDTGQHIVAHQSGDQMVVYQAYKSSIANFAVKHQQLGGAEFSYNRMSWIKPNFLWMMFRCGWAGKENQERVLAIWLQKADFDNLLQQAVHSSYNSLFYQTPEEWSRELESKNVRLQWDPDHNPYGYKLPRRALQLGIKGKLLEAFGKEQICLIEDITDFVKQQYQFVRAQNLDALLVPIERVYRPADNELCKKTGIEV